MWQHQPQWIQPAALLTQGSWSRPASRSWRLQRGRWNLSRVEVSPQMDRRTSDRLLLRSVRESGRWLAVMAAVALLLALAETALPAFLGKAVDAVLTGDAALGWTAATAVLVLVLVAADAADDVAVGGSVASSTA